MKPPRLWRYRPAAAPACGTQPPSPVPAFSPGVRFRHCDSCQVQWHGGPECWCGPDCGHGCSGQVTA